MIRLKRIQPESSSSRNGRENLERVLETRSRHSRRAGRHIKYLSQASTPQAPPQDDELRQQLAEQKPQTALLSNAVTAMATTLQSHIILVHNLPPLTPDQGDANDDENDGFNGDQCKTVVKNFVKSAVVREAGGPITVEEIKVDPPKASEVRIKTLYASICHTDILCCKGSLFPRIPGHEGVGVVESMGNEVKTGLKLGDIVIPVYLGECGECLNCKSRRTNICHVYSMRLDGLMPDGSSRMFIAATGESIYHHFSCSTWSEYTVIDINYVLKVDPNMHLPHASFLSFGFTTGFGSTWKEAKIPKGSSVAVFGLGAVGLGAIKGAAVQGASKIIGVDINESKAAKGKVFGMTNFINPKDHPNQLISDLVRDATDGLGVDYCFECTGVPSLLNEAMDASKLGIGTTIMIGFGIEMNLAIKTLTIIPGRTLKGSIFGGIRTQSDLPVILQKCLNKEIELEELLTHEIQLKNIQEAFDILKKPECLKILINF